MDAGALAQHILDTHHAYLHTNLPKVREALRGAPASVGVPFLQLFAVLDEHLTKEERILFPHILEGGELAWLEAPITQMRAEHQVIEKLMARLREVAGEAGAGREPLLALLDDLAVHARREDEELFPAVLGKPFEPPEPAPPPPPPRATPSAPPRRGLRARLRGLFGS